MPLILLMILCGLTTSCTINRPPTLIEGKDGDDLIKGCPSKVNDKMWMTYDYANRYYHWKNHK